VAHNEPLQLRGVSFLLESVAGVGTYQREQADCDNQDSGCNGESVRMKTSPSISRNKLPETANMTFPMNLESATMSHFAFSSGGMVLYPAIRKVAFPFTNKKASTINNTLMPVRTVIRCSLKYYWAS